MLRAVAMAVVALFVLTMAAHAVPAWGRRTGADCSSCHWGLNKLNHTGRMFLLRGHRMPDEEGIGNEGYNLTEYTSWASKVRFVADKDADPSTKFDVEALSIYSGGPIDKNFSYFFEYYMHERAGDAAGAGSRSKLADAYLFYNSDAAADTFYWVRAGQIYPYLIYYYGSGGRLSISRNEAINRRPGGGNDYTPRDRAYGVSAGYVYEGNLLAEVGIVNSGGGNATPNIAETNNFKDVYATVEYVLDESGTGIGVYGYSGKFKTAGGPEDKFDRVGVFANYTTPQYTISAGALSGKHDLPASRRVRTWFAELGYNFTNTTLGWVRYDHFYRDIAADAENRLVGLSVGVSHRLNSVGRLVVEYRNRKYSGKSDVNDLTVELNWLF